MDCWRKACTPERMFQDLRFTLRTLRQSPGFALIAILSLALGIGANSAIFSLANAVLLRPMPVPNPSQLIAVQSRFQGESLVRLFQNSGLSYPDYTDLRDTSKSFDALAASEYSPFGFATDKSALPRMKFGQLVSGSFFRVMEVPPILGRNFRPDEDQVKGRDAVVMLGYDLWKTEFGSDPDVVGKTLYLNGIAFSVIGVAPESFTGSQLNIRSSLYVPMAMEPSLAGNGQHDMLQDRSQRQLTVQGRLKPGVSVAEAGAETGVIAQQLGLSHPDTNRTCQLVVDTDLRSRLTQNPYGLMVVVLLLGLAGVVLLIACANVANLMLSRASARSREIAVRLAIGAGRGRLVRQLMTESLLIALLSGLLGLQVAQTFADMLSQLRVPGDIPVVIDVRLDTQVLLFATLASVLSALVFGLAPALQSTRPDLVPALKSGRSEGGRRRRFLGRNSLVIAQVAGALLLLVCATQAYRGAEILLTSPAGFRTDHLLTASFNPVLARYTPDRAQEFYKELLDKSRTMTGVKSAALAETVPIVPGSEFRRLVPEGVQLTPGTDAISLASNVVSEGYFGAVGIPIVEGREFQVTDRANSPQVAIVNELFAHKYYPNGSAIGRRLRLNSIGGPPVEIVGVARQSKYFFMMEPPFDYLYLPLAQHPQPGMSILMHTAGPSSGMAEPLRDMVRSIDAGQPVIGIRTIEEIFDQRNASMGLLIEAIGSMGLLGLGMALVGLYGLVSYSVSLRAREIGIRMAIGADQSGVLRMVLRQGMLLTGCGVAVGLLFCVPASRAVSAALSVPSFNPTLLTLVAAGLVLVAALGAYVPARRAALLDPNVVLRQE